MTPAERRMARAGDPRRMTDAELRVAALDEAMHHPGRLGSPWPPAVAEAIARRPSVTGSAAGPRFRNGAR